MSLTSSRAAGANPDLGDMSWYVGGRRSDDCFQSGIGIGRLGRRTSRLNVRTPPLLRPLFALGGLDARYLEGGITGWAEFGLPLRKKVTIASGSWVTRERPKIDRIACPWLIRRFIDPEATFLFAPTEQVFDVATTSGAIAYDIPGAEPFSHDGELCSFDAFLRVYEIRDAALDTLAIIVRGAYTARLDLAPQPRGCSRSRSGCQRTSQMTTRCSSPA